MAIRSRGDEMRWWWGGWNKGAFDGGALTNPDEGSQAVRPAPIRSAANIVVSDERAMMISTVFACVRILVQTGSTLPLRFFTRAPDGREVLDEDHYLYALLKYKPNNFMTAKEFRQALWTQRVMWGNGYAKIKWMGVRPVSLTPLKPENMEVKRSTTGLEYHYSTANEVIVYKQKDIFHLKGFGSDGITGFSAIGYMRETLGLTVSADQSAAKSIGGTANAVLETDQWPDDNQKEDLSKMYGGGNKADVFQSDGQLMIVVGGMKYRLTGIDPDKLQLLGTRQNQVAEICRYFGVPVVMVDGSMGAGAAWPASYEAQVLYMLAFTLKPYLDEWEDKVPWALLTPADQRIIIVEHSVEGLLRTDSEKRASFYASAVQNGWMTRAEVRRLENLPPVEGSGELTVQVNLTPLEQLEKVNGDSNAIE